MKRLVYTSLIAIVLDRIIKLLVMSLDKSIVIIKNFFNITYVTNLGGAWSILSGHRWLLVIVGILALILIYFVFIRNTKLNKLSSITLGLLIGGITSNLLDRIIYGYVIDYLDFNIFGYNYPIFNLADSLIVISVIILIFIEFKGDKHVRG